MLKLVDHLNLAGSWYKQSHNSSSICASTSQLKQPHTKHTRMGNAMKNTSGTWMESPWHTVTYQKVSMCLVSKIKVQILEIEISCMYNLYDVQSNIRYD